MEILQALKSKKLIVAIIAAAMMVANDVMGKPVSSEAVYAILGVLGVYILGQGCADHGAQGAAKAAERAIKQGSDVAEAVIGVLGARSGGIRQSVHDDKIEDGPEWEDTSEMDREDRPMEIQG